MKESKKHWADPQVKYVQWKIKMLSSYLKKVQITFLKEKCFMSVMKRELNVLK